MSIAERGQRLVDALGIPPDVAATMRPTFFAGFSAALGALTELGSLETEAEARSMLLAWHAEVQSDADPIRPH